MPRTAPPPLVTCSCGRPHTAESWHSLRYVGLQDDGEGGWLELRDCRCESTIAVPVEARRERGAAA